MAAALELGGSGGAFLLFVRQQSRSLLMVSSANQNARKRQKNREQMIPNMSHYDKIPTCSPILWRPRRSLKPAVALASHQPPTGTI